MQPRELTSFNNHHMGVVHVQLMLSILLLLLLLLLTLLILLFIIITVIKNVLIRVLLFQRCHRAHYTLLLAIVVTDGNVNSFSLLQTYLLTIESQ